MSDHFSANKEIRKYKLDHSTFDLIDITKFHNTKASTIAGYIWSWVLVVLAWALVGVDIYTCLNILVFHHWSSTNYKPYAYSIAKWIFTGCIIFQFVLLLYHWIWAIHTYRTKNIALAYVNSIAKTLYTIRSYNYHCLFHKIEQDNFFDRSCFFTYQELDNALQILIADTPRQVINILTLRYYATDGEVSNDIISNIKDIANTNLTLSVILSFMCLSVGLFSIFFFKFCLGMLFYLPVIYKLRKRGFKSLKKYCCKLVNDRVRTLVLNHHKPQDELLEKGILDLSQIKANPLLNNDLTLMDNDFDYKPHNNYSLQEINPFNSTDSLVKPPRTFNYNLRKEPTSNPFEDSQSTLRNLSQTSLNPLNPFEPASDIEYERKIPKNLQKAQTLQNLQKAQTVENFTFDRSYTDIHNGNNPYNQYYETSTPGDYRNESQMSLQERKMSQSSLTYHQNQPHSSLNEPPPRMTSSVNASVNDPPYRMTNSETMNSLPYPIREASLLKMKRSMTDPKLASEQAGPSKRQYPLEERLNEQPYPIESESESEDESRGYPLRY